MTGYIIIFLLINTAALLLLPRRWAPLPLLMGVCYVAREQLLIGSLHFSVIRLLVAVGVVRIIMRGERLEYRINALDKIIIAWSVWMLFSSLFHKDPSAALVFRVGLVFDTSGIYFLIRVFCRSLDDVKGLCRAMAILLLPVALEMVYEKLTTHNLFYALGGNSMPLYIRHGRVRAQGPFAHSILAGTVGAVCLPLMIGIWSQHRKNALIGIGACLVIIIASASSGPIITGIAAAGALLMWRYRDRMTFVRWLLIVGYIALDLVMKDPAYYLVARIDLAGGSTSWYRARLIQSAIEHLSEWWLGGTDYTRHWMSSGLSATDQHTDITSHYLQMGVIGGLPSMLLFIAVLAIGFSFVGRTMRQMPELSTQSQFMIWALGASLFSHAVTFLSVSYTDQSVAFLYLTLAVIGSVRYGAVNKTVEEVARDDQSSGSAAMVFSDHRGTN